MDKIQTTVPLQGTEEYKQALKALAGTKKLKLGQLIRIAVENVYGHELKPYLDFFDAQNGSKNFHSDTDAAGADESAV